MTPFKNFCQDKLFDVPVVGARHSKPERTELKQPSSSKLAEVEALNKEVEAQWGAKLHLDTSLTRPLVSFQANKSRAVYRWFKYKEAFSANLVEHLLSKHKISGGVLIDPFAGTGTALFAAAGFGMRGEGIELLPIGQTVISTRQVIESGIKPEDVERLVSWRDKRPWYSAKAVKAVNELRITRGAYPSETKTLLGQFLSALEGEDEKVRTVLFFALLCILESISYTRKDGQYLRWDYRSGRRQGKKVFDKGEIQPFDKAMTGKIQEIVADLRGNEVSENLFPTSRSKAKVRLRAGSCLALLPTLEDESYDCLITSPPYCNRYDYTRTYALELALLGVDESGLAELRQGMISCTVENRAKDLLALNPKWKRAIGVADRQELLQAILSYLDEQKHLDLLNNNGIPRMVRGYFYEMACVIAECARVLKRGAPFIMVNDNVRYAGASISVDIILSQIAEELGFQAQEILVLPTGKGNSSQQMGAHGREALRKCVYIWRKA